MDLFVVFEWGIVQEVVIGVGDFFDIFVGDVCGEICEYFFFEEIEFFGVVVEDVFYEIDFVFGQFVDFGEELCVVEQLFEVDEIEVFVVDDLLGV